MKRTQPITEDEYLAEVKRLPAFMGDLHWANFGRLDGNVVCHDYGYHKGYEILFEAGIRKVIHK